ncbi:dihydropteroate synthase [Babesia caballi]|uniref:Dihydropteroate synthase n=1 Tax=Babesia caballi TaxID=5871 RepID=A0AAV4LPK2_BABCB|nr:dihydropteroate synthase [Babesia caballi]
MQTQGAVKLLEHVAGPVDVEKERRAGGGEEGALGRSVEQDLPIVNRQDGEVVGVGVEHAHTGERARGGTYPVAREGLDDERVQRVHVVEEEGGAQVALLVQDQKHVELPVAAGEHAADEARELHKAGADAAEPADVAAAARAAAVLAEAHGGRGAGRKQMAEVVEVTARKVTTGFGFKNHIAANVLREDKVHDLQSAVRVLLIDEYLLHVEPTCRDIFEPDLNDVEATVERCGGRGWCRVGRRWCLESAEFNEALTSALDKVRSTFVLVPGYEKELCSTLCSQVERAVAAYFSSKNDEHKCSQHSMCEVTLNFVFMHLNEHIMAHLRDTYQKQEDLVQNRILKLRKEMNLNSTLNLLDGKRQVTNYNLLPPCEALKMMGQTRLPQEKLKHLALAVQFNKPESRDESVSLFILALVAGGLTDAVANYALVDMYAAAKFCRHKVPTQHLETFRDGIQFLLD